MSNRLKLKLRNCYGIGELESELVFKHRGYAIYAPNGVMKTSLARTLMDLSKEDLPSDLVFPARETTCRVTLDGEPLAGEHIFVVESYNESYASDEVTTLLARKDLRKRYESVRKDIAKAQKELDKQLRELAGFGSKSREDIEAIIERVFGAKYFDALSSLHDVLPQTVAEGYADADYKLLFDPKVRRVLEEDGVGETVREFAEKYEELTQKSPILRRDFQYHNASEVKRQLRENRFFEAGHSVKLLDESTEVFSELTSHEALLEVIEVAKNAVLEDEELRRKFDSFNGKIKNKELKEFRDYITTRQHLLPELEDLESFERKLWIQYLLRARGAYENVVAAYQSGRQEIAEIVEEASSSVGDWEAVLTEFNDRFVNLPFSLHVGNKSEVILEGSAPSIEFTFTDGNEDRHYSSSQKSDLLRVLSTGERRALYLLNIMFEVRSRWKERKRTLFVFDDVADSFDYKNKFAIVEYLQFLVSNDDNQFLVLVLTHNFDFLRTIASRMVTPPHQCVMATRAGGEVRLKKFDYFDIINPIRTWVRRLNEGAIRIAFIPFLRNIIEYTDAGLRSDDDRQADLASLSLMLHYEDATEQITMQDYFDVLAPYYPDAEFPGVDLRSSVLDNIFETAGSCSESAEGVSLEQKIVLSVAIRLWAERYMLTKIRGVESEYDNAGKSTNELAKAFESRFNNMTSELTLLRRVCLTTPANIHMNAFMYEPILDMGFDDLFALYGRVTAELI